MTAGGLEVCLISGDAIKILVSLAFICNALQKFLVLNEL